MSRIARRLCAFFALRSLLVTWPGTSAAQDGLGGSAQVLTVTDGSAITAAVPIVAPATPTNWLLMSHATGLDYSLLTAPVTPATLQIPLALPGGAHTLETATGAGALRAPWTGPTVMVAPDAAVRSLIVPPGLFDPVFAHRHYRVLPVYQQGDLGQGQTIVLYKDAEVNWAEIQAFDTLFGLPPRTSARWSRRGPSASALVIPTTPGPVGRRKNRHRSGYSDRRSTRLFQAPSTVTCPMSVFWPGTRPSS